MITVFHYPLGATNLQELQGVSKVGVEEQVQLGAACGHWLADVWLAGGSKQSSRLLVLLFLTRLSGEKCMKY